MSEPQHFLDPLMDRFEKLAENYSNGKLFLIPVVFAVVTITFSIIGWAMGELPTRFLPASAEWLIKLYTWGSDFWQNFGTEMFGAAITFVLLEVMLAGRRVREANDREKARLILQMGSPTNDFAVEAVRLLRARNWLTDGSMDGASLLRANLAGAWLRAANLAGANLHWANLLGADLYRANLVGANLSETNLMNANLWDANLATSRLTKANLADAKLFGTNLEGAYLHQANLARADLIRTNLTGASLIGADLTGTMLRWANLTGADMSSVNLAGAELWNANLENAVLAGATFDEETFLPDSDPLGSSLWTPDTDMTRFTNPKHPKFWRSDNPMSPAYRGNDDAETSSDSPNNAPPDN